MRAGAAAGTFYQDFQDYQDCLLLTINHCSATLLVKSAPPLMVKP
jgi:hypothetical protein